MGGGLDGTIGTAIRCYWHSGPVIWHSDPVYSTAARFYPQALLAQRPGLNHRAYWHSGPVLGLRFLLFLYAP